MNDIRKPSLDIDANNIGYKFLGYANGEAGCLFQLAEILSEVGIDITFVADPPYRHHSKRATIERKSKVERARLKCMDLQRELAVLLQENCSTTDEVVKNLQDDIKKERNKSTRSLPDKLDALRDAGTHCPHTASYEELMLLYKERVLNSKYQFFRESCLATVWQWVAVVHLPCAPHLTNCIPTRS